MKKFLSALFFMQLTCAFANQGSDAGGAQHPRYRHSDIDMPVSLAIGNVVRTPQFPVRHEAYFIMVQAEKSLPFLDMVCMMGITMGPSELEECRKANKQLSLQANWTVLDGEHLVAQGSSTEEHDGEYTNKYLFKFVGEFKGEAGKKYSVEVKFIKDGTPLNVANPHLIVILVRYH